MENFDTLRRQLKAILQWDAEFHLDEASILEERVAVLHRVIRKDEIRLTIQKLVGNN